MYRSVKKALLVMSGLFTAGVVAYVGFILYMAKKAAYYSNQKNEDSINEEDL